MLKKTRTFLQYLLKPHHDMGGVAKPGQASVVLREIFRLLGITACF